MSDTPPDSGRHVRWGVLGCASIFRRRMLPAFRLASNAHLQGVASRDGEKADAFAREHGIERSYGSYEALLADPDIEAVYIPLPNDLHVEWTDRALDAGKHVLCDKPAALSYRDAVRMADRARANGLRLEEAVMCRHHPQHARMAEIARSGEIGAPVHFRSSFTYPAVFAPGFRMDPARGGGALYDVGVYPVNTARLHLDAEPIAVTAIGVFDPESGIDIRASALLEFASGHTATLDCGFDQTYTTRCELIGRDGVIGMEKAFQPGDGPATLTIRRGDEIRTEQTEGANQYACEIENFGRAVREPEYRSPGEDGTAQSRVIEAIQRSMREKRRVTVDEVLV